MVNILLIVTIWHTWTCRYWQFTIILLEKLFLVYFENNEKKKNIKINNSKKYTKVTENALQ
jgi:hypothetical protein